MTPANAFDAQSFEYQFPSVIAAKLAIAEDLAQPLAKMAATDRTFIDQVLAETLTRSMVLAGHHRTLRWPSSRWRR